MKRARLIAAAAVLAVVAGLAIVAAERLTASPPSCGSFTSFIAAGRNEGNPGAELCFVRAFRTCTPRSLSMGIEGVDTFDHEFLRVERGGGSCRIVTESGGRYDLPLGLLHERVVCTGMRWTGRDWALTGCDGDVAWIMPWAPAHAGPAGRVVQDPSLG